MSAFSFERDVENGTNTWLTPRWVLDPIGTFDLDPCAHRAWPTATEQYCWPEKDGLWLPWSGRVWCNPPYGIEAKAFIERMAIHNHGTLLVFARTETEGFRRAWQTATAMLFIYRRIAFLRPDGSASGDPAAPSVLIAFGADDAAILRTAKASGALDGAYVDRWCA